MRIIIILVPIIIQRSMISRGKLQINILLTKRLILNQDHFRLALVLDIKVDQPVLLVDDAPFLVRQLRVVSFQLGNVLVPEKT
jgi:hypothetical protein